MVKSKFDDLYDLASPVSYARAMRELEYRDPDYLFIAKPAFETFVQSLAGNRHCGSIKVVDLCAGYGVNALTLKYGIEDTAVYEWLKEPIFPLIPCEARKWIGPQSVLVGLDVAKNALEFAKQAALIDCYIHRNLEMENLSPEERDLIADCDVIISTGSLSYISEITLGKVLAAIQKNRPLLAMFWPLLGTDTQKIDAVLAAAGLTTRTDPTLLRQRAYKSEAERQRYADYYQKRGISIKGTIAEDCLCANHLYAIRT